MASDTDDLIPNGEPHPLLGVAILMSFVLGLLMALASPFAYQTAEAHGPEVGTSHVQAPDAIAEDGASAREGAH